MLVKTKLTTNLIVILLARVCALYFKRENAGILLYFTDIRCLQSKQKTTFLSLQSRRVVDSRYCSPLLILHPRRWGLSDHTLWHFAKYRCLSPRAGRGLPPVYGLTGCLADGMKKRLYLSLVPAIVTEAVLCFCMLYKAWTMFTNDYGSPILKLLIRDRSVLFCFLVRCSPAALILGPLGQCTLLLEVNGCVIISHAVAVMTTLFLNFYSIFLVLLTNALLFSFAPRDLVLIGLG